MSNIEYMESFHSLRQYNAKLQTHPLSTLNVKIPNFPKLHVYVKNIKYRTSLENMPKLFSRSVCHTSAEVL